MQVWKPGAFTHTERGFAPGWKFAQAAGCNHEGARRKGESNGVCNHSTRPWRMVHGAWCCSCLSYRQLVQARARLLGIQRAAELGQQRGDGGLGLGHAAAAARAAPGTQDLHAHARATAMAGTWPPRACQQAGTAQRMQHGHACCACTWPQWAGPRAPMQHVTGASARMCSPHGACPQPPTPNDSHACMHASVDVAFNTPCPVRVRARGSAYLLCAVPVAQRQQVLQLGLEVQRGGARRLHAQHACTGATQLTEQASAHMPQHRWQWCRSRSRGFGAVRVI